MHTRRRVLTWAAGAIAVTAMGAAGVKLLEVPDEATAPWQRAAEGYSDPRLDALGYAILAPNPHNRQPWQARLMGEDALEITCDLGRRLPDTDPFGRQITIGFGCFLELFSISAREKGYRAEIDLWPDGEPLPRLDARAVARIRMVPDASLSADPLFAFALHRRSNKENYDRARAVDAGVLPKLKAATVHSGASVAFGASIEANRVAALRDLSYRAHEVESLTPRTMQESIDLMRIGSSEVAANPDGISLGGPKMTLLKGMGIMNRKAMADPTSTAFRQGLEMFHTMLHSAMGHVWLATPGNSRTDQIAAGRSWVRVNLAATAQGLAVHPLSQVLQEYAEMAPLYDELHQFLGVEAPSRVQMFGRIGYGPALGHSPRWPLETRLISA